MTAIEFSNQILSYQNRLKGFAYSLVSDKDDVNDLIQETYLKAISYKDKLDDYSNLKMWVLTIMRNVFINSYRKKTKQRSYMLENKEVSKNQSYEATDSYYTSNEIKKAISSLGQEIGEPFKMYVDGYKYKEIAQKMDINIGTVKSRIFTARKKLSDLLKDYK